MKTRPVHEIGLISIVIPALNEERFLPVCLRSLEEQDYQGPYEIVVADNGSTDNTAGIARSFGATVIACSGKKSVFFARQAGADAARGEIVAQADADSIYPRDWLSRIASLLATHPEAVAVTGRFVYRDPPFWARLEYWLRSATNRASCLLLGGPLVISGATFAFRRTAFLAFNGYHGLTFAPDQFGIASRLAQHGKVAFDGKLTIVTSARRVKKPLTWIAFDLGRHLSRWGLYCGKCGLAALADFVTKTNTRRIAFPISTMLILFVIYGYFVPQSTVFGPVFSEVNTKDRMVALTFDDGPNEPYTSQVLDILDSSGIKATFFLIGQNVLLYPAVARRMLEDGHAIGNHTYSHNANHALTAAGGKDIQRAQQVISSTLGVTPHLYRPPHGKKTPWEIEEAAKEKLVEVNWTVSTNELNGRSAATMADKIARATDPGEIILLHDGYGADHNVPQANKSVTVATLPLLIDKLQAKGYHFVTVSELLNLPAYNERPPE